MCALAARGGRVHGRRGCICIFRLGRLPRRGVVVGARSHERRFIQRLSMMPMPVGWKLAGFLE